MKTSIILLLTCMFLFNCSEELEQKSNKKAISQSNDITWKASTFSKHANRIIKNTSSYTFGTLQLNDLLKNNNLSHFHFKLEMNDEKQLEVKSEGIAKDGKILGYIYGEFEDINIDLEKLKSMPNPSTEKIGQEHSVIAQHILQPAVASSYIEQWNNKLKQDESIIDLMSYDGEIIQYYIVEKEIILNLISRQYTSKLALFWGLNGEQKLTPVFMRMGSDNKVVLGSQNEVGDVFDVVRPVPPFGQDDDNSNLN